MPEMTYKRLGGSGLKLSTFSIGSWVTFGGQQDMQTSKQCLLAAHEAGGELLRQRRGLRWRSG